MIQGNINWSIKKRAFDNGVSYYLVKPFAPEYFFKIIKSVLNIINRNQKAINMDIKNILIVEDEEFLQLLIEQTFIASKYNVTIVSNGNEAINQLLTNKYDIVLMDIEMPIMNGIETIKKIRKELKNNIPVIAVTGHHNTKVLDNLLKQGFDTYMSKPYNLKDIEAVFKEVENRNYKQHKQLDKGKTPLGNNKIYDLRNLEELVSGDKDFFIEMIQMFIQDTPKILNELIACYKNKNWEDLRITAHKLGGRIDLCGLKKIGKKIDFIEENSKNKSNILEIKIHINDVVEDCFILLNELKKDYKLK